VNVATVSALLNDVAPETLLPPGPVTVNDAVLGTTASENVAVGSVDTGLLDEPATGVALTTVGGEGGGPVVLNITSTA
jgi:hypothetical protein